MKDSKKLITLRVSKIKSGDRYEFLISAIITGATNYIHTFSPPPSTIEIPGGRIPSRETDMWHNLQKHTHHALAIIFRNASKNDYFVNESTIEYKCIFSDKFIVYGGVSLDDNIISGNKHIVLPMNNIECQFIYDCLLTNIDE
jgi:hypothetical protein